MNDKTPEEVAGDKTRDFYDHRQRETSAQAAARQRADYQRALKEELDMCERGGKADRVKAIKAELERVSGKPADRQEPRQQTTEQSGPQETAAAPAKKAAASRRGRGAKKAAAAEPAKE